MYNHLQESHNILIAGCGGGYDIYTAIPLYEELIKTKSVYMANYTFTNIYEIKNEMKKIDDYCLIVDENTKSIHDDDYFPELLLAKKLKIPIYTFRQVSPNLLYESYNKLIKNLNIDTIILIDGGIDSLLFGDEQMRGSPLEDLTSVIAVNKISNELLIKSYLYCTAIGIDDIDVNMFLRNTSTLIKQKGFVGFYSIQNCELYKSIIQSTNPKSIINESIIASLNGEYGKYKNPNLINNIHDDSYPLINPLVSSYWIYDIKILSNTSPLISHIHHVYYDVNRKINNMVLETLFFNNLINEFFENKQSLV